MTPLVRNVAITFVVVLGLYEGGLRMTSPSLDSGQDQFTTNVIRLENYVDHPEGRGTVIVGSSLAARIPEELLPPDWRNLSLAGDSALTGLEVVANVPQPPKRVLVEINLLDRSGDSTMIQHAVAWPQPQLRQLFWFYRTAYRPMNLLVSTVSKFVKGRHRGSEIQSKPPNFQGLLAAQAQDFAKPPNTALAVNLEHLSRLVTRLRARGAKVAFFEMPIDHSLTDTPRANMMRSAVRKMFDDKHYCWLDLDNGENWQTGDGLHLLRQDGAKIAARIVAAQCESARTAATGARSAS